MSQERVSKKSNVLKERLNKDVFALRHGQSIILNLSYQLVDRGVGKKPALHLFASVNKAYTTPPGTVTDTKHLSYTDYGPLQLQLRVQVAQRVEGLTAAELAQFQKGGYIGVGVEVN